MFRFTVRDIALAMTVVGLAAGWWLDHRKIAGEREVLLLDNDALRRDVERLNSVKIHAERFVVEQRAAEERQRQAAIAKLREKGFKLPAGADQPLYPAGGRPGRDTRETQGHDTAQP